MFDKQNIRVQYLKISERIRNFLLSKKSREFLVFLLFVFLSSSFWLLLVLNDEYETEVTIPFRMKNVPENVVLTSELPQELKVGVKDRGTVLVNYLLGQTFYPVTIDFEDYADRGNQVRFLSRSLDKRISSQFNQSTKLLSVKPDTLELIYTRAKAKKVPVRLRGEVKAERQFYISDIVYSPDSVMVYAPNEILDTITAAYTENLYLDQVADTTHLRVNLKPVKGARFTPSYNDVTFYVDIYSEKSLEVPVIGVNFPDDKTLRTFPSKVQVTFQVGLSQFKYVTEENFKVVVDYNTLEGNGNEKCKLHLLEIPANVIHTRINPKEIDYIIEQKVYSYD